MEATKRHTFAPPPTTPTSRHAEAFFNRPDWKRFQIMESPLVPLLAVDAEGTIQHISPAARRLLEYPSGASPDPCFFTHVHGRNLYRVMQDIANMVCHRQQQVEWLLRLKTGRGRHRWFKAAVHNRLYDDEARIVMILEAL